MVRIDVQSHKLVPKHTLLSAKETEQFLAEYGIGKEQLPKILIRDPVIRAVGGKEGDVVRIERNSPTAGIAIAYRLIIEG